MCLEGTPSFRPAGRAGPVPNEQNPITAATPPRARLLCRVCTMSSPDWPWASTCSLINLHRKRSAPVDTNQDQLESGGGKLR